MKFNNNSKIKMLLKILVILYKNFFLILFDICIYVYFNVDEIIIKN